MTTLQKKSSLNEMQLDVIREIGNIGAGNAVTSLASLLDEQINMSIPQVGLVSMQEFCTLAGGYDSVSACVYLPVEGDAPGHVAFLMSETAAMHMASRML